MNKEVKRKESFRGKMPAFSFFNFLFLVFYFLFLPKVSAQETLNEPLSSTYETHIEHAEAAWAKRDLYTALLEYGEALDIDASDSLLVEKYKQCYLIWRNNCGSYRDGYNVALEMGNVFFKGKAYEKAENMYLKAGEICPWEAEPKRKLEEVRKAIKNE